MKSNQGDEVKPLSTQNAAECSSDISQATHVSGTSFDSTTETGEKGLQLGRDLRQVWRSTEVSVIAIYLR
jgi:hypothetical protein